MPSSSHRMDALPLAREHLDELRGALRARQLAVFLDYDGTLTPIVDRPEQADLGQEVRETLARLARRCVVAVISGRDLQDVRNRVGLDSVLYAGSHGFDIAGPGGWHETPAAGDEFMADLDAAEKQLRAALDGIAGVAVERKAFSISVHHRRAAPDAAEQVEREVDRVLADLPRLAKGHGKKVVQIGPGTGWNKGAAVQWLLEAFDLDRPDVLPIYIGDDLTDESAFQALGERALRIVVRDGDRQTAADYALDGPGEVRSFLDLLLATQAGPAP